MNRSMSRYAISDRNLGRQAGLLAPEEQARRLAAEGLDYFQLREKDLLPSELTVLARKVLDAIAGTSTRLLLNGRVDVAAAVGVHGVHLTSSMDELTPSEVNRVYAAAQRPLPIVTVSCHSLDDVIRVRGDLPEAILFGPIFGKTVAGAMVVEGLGLAALREACRVAAPVPVFALGGVTEENASLCLEAGAAGVAGIRLFQRREP